MRSFKIRGERLLHAIDFMSRVQRDVRPNRTGALPDDHPDRPLAVRFQMHGILTRISVAHLWTDAVSLLRRNPAFLVADVEIGGLVDDLKSVCHPSIFQAFMAFLSAVAAGEVTEGDLQP